MKKTTLVLSIAATILTSTASAQYTVYGGSSSGDYYGMAQKTVEQLSPALEKQWVTEGASAGTTAGSPVIIQNVCDDTKASGFIQGNLEVPDCARVAKEKVASEIVFAVVNPWIAKKVPGYETNRLAVWQALLSNKDKVTFYTRKNSGHEATHLQLQSISGLPEGVDGGSSNVQILNAVKANQLGVSIFTQFARPDSQLFKDAEKLGLVIIPVMTPEMKTFQLNGTNVYSVCPDAKVSSSLWSKSVTITTACVGANYVVNPDAPTEFNSAVGEVDFAEVVPSEGLFSKLKSKIGSGAGGATSQFDSLMKKASEGMKSIDLKLN